MIESNVLKNTIVRINKILQDSGIRFHFTGGIASTYYGEPRFTQDLDIVLRLSSGILDVKKLLSILDQKYIVDEKAIMDAFVHQKLFQALDKETFIKIDFYSFEKIPDELSRTVTRELFPGIIIPMVSVEDAILSKLIWIKEGSDKARQDVKAMVSINQNLDFIYLRRNATSLGLLSLLKTFFPLSKDFP